jgi:hypothetical protein
METGGLMEITEQKKRQRHLDRIKLSADSFAKVDSWITDLKSSVQGINVSHNDLVNWTMSRFAANLTDEDKQELKSHYFDEVKFLKVLLIQAKRAKANGEKVELGQLASIEKTKRVYRKRKPSQESQLVTITTEA